MGEETLRKPTDAVFAEAELRIGGFGDRLLRQADAPAEKDRALVLRPRTITVLLGPNGAGKTRLLEIAAGLRDPEGLAVSYGGEALWRKGRRRLKLRPDVLKRYSYACQSAEEQLFARSVEAELRYVLAPFGGGEAEVAARVEEALRAVGWDPTWLARDPYAMSGGERRRTALACAFAAPAPWLLLDEPTSGLDARAHEMLAARLLAERERGRGVLLVSHDADWALPLADMLLLMAPGGRIRPCTPEELLARPEWWREAGMDIPAWFEIARAGWRMGLSADEVLDPRRLAARLGGEGSGEIPSPLAPVSPEPAVVSPTARHARADAPPDRSALQAVSPAKPHPLLRFDPRSVWLCYILLSLALFSIQTWISLAAGAVVTFAAVRLGRFPLRRWRGVLLGFASFAVSATLLAGWTGSGGDGLWHADAARATLLSFGRTWLVLLLGLGLPLAIPPLRLRRSLLQLSTFRGRTSRRVQQVVLTVTLILRFVPQLLDEWGRFTRIAIARGKENAKTPGAIARRLKETSVPFLLALFRMGDQVSLALESRGVGRVPQPTMSERLRWRGGDWLLLLAVGGIAAALAIGGRLGWY
ncbi:ATP-binding cassette domain-containing protein [Cohnella sp. REN36]|uniref:ATP-binding cassette domain-containing protein n=1 Tax=Cohnella sp. REN36 TaxID=2887347 RepID=UPI001D139B37|nr:ATP-binding cassette domain-containing protein [Cohnella sp. REN36]MCC3371781.1 ATP-binding cassette domain-containing protein [Cohnella sp. REN36]